MSTTIDQQAASQLATRILREGYGDGAWHGPELKAALADVTPDLAFWRPGPERHNIAEIAVHHAFTTHGVRAKLSADVEPFALKGEDWFELPDPSTLSWAEIRELVALEHHKLQALAVDVSGGRAALSDSERFDLMLGITCHAVYHAGQIQLIKRLRT